MIRFGLFARKAAAAVAAAVFAIGALLPAAGLYKKVSADTEFMSAAEAASAMNVGWNLGNTLDSYGTWISGTAPSSFETAWGNPVTTAGLIAAVKDAGFNSIRIPVTWAQHIDSAGNIDGAWLDRVTEVVDYAMSLDMYVILNVHHDTGEHGGDKVAWLVADTGTIESERNRYSILWTQICNRFADYGDHLLFEGYNEILDSSNSWGHASDASAYTAVNDLAQLFVDTVRAAGGNNARRNLIVNTYVASHEQQVLDAFVLPSDPASGHLLAEVHVYAPWGFTGTSESVTWTSVHDDFTDADRAEITGVLNDISAFSSRIGVPVIIGECGAELKDNDSERAAYAAYLVSEAASRGIKCFWWDNGLTYSIFDRSSETPCSAVVEALVSNAVSTAPSGQQAEETEAAGTSAAAETTETAAAEMSSSDETTAVSETDDSYITTAAEESDAAASAETTVTASLQTDTPSQKKGFNPLWAVWIALGVVAVAVIYKFVFDMGKKHPD
uniref:B-1,4-endoglucanase n=1 Tax=uncultured bacterium Contig783 TaxID=1393612 RepID=W0FP00_9BACT|nr:B-1,4-endoglucanase [uncultured bacterium Contig783]